LREIAVTSVARRGRTLGQVLLLTAGLLVLVAIGASSVILVNRARSDSARVVHTVEVEKQLNMVLLEVRRAESAARGYLLTRGAEFRADHDEAAAAIGPDLDKLGQLTADNPFQVENVSGLRMAVTARLAQFARDMRPLKQGERPAAAPLVRDAAVTQTTATIQALADAMLAEEERLLAIRKANAKRSQSLASLVTIAGTGFVFLLATISLVLVRRSAHARDEAETRLRENNFNLEAAVHARTADLRELNDEIQRFAYIISHDLRSPLVNIMGFTSELEALRADIFRRIASLAGDGVPTPPLPGAADDTGPELEGVDKQLSEDFGEALGFIKSSIGKMDRLIGAILSLTREGRRDFKLVPIETTKLVESIVSTLAHQAADAQAEIHVAPLPRIVSDRVALEQIFSNLIDNAIKYLKPGVDGEIHIGGRSMLGFAVFEIADNGRGIDPKYHQRIFDLFRRAGTPDRPGQGIGLAHVRALVRRLGGTISVASEPDEGSIFTITLPINSASVNRTTHK
jgi:signal transduction histidine kinase